MQSRRLLAFAMLACGMLMLVWAIARLLDPGSQAAPAAPAPVALAPSEPVPPAPRQPEPRAVCHFRLATDDGGRVESPSVRYLALPEANGDRRGLLPAEVASDGRFDLPCADGTDGFRVIVTAANAARTRFVCKRASGVTELRVMRLLDVTVRVLDGQTRAGIAAAQVRFTRLSDPACEGTVLQPDVVATDGQQVGIVTGRHELACGAPGYRPHLATQAFVRSGPLTIELTKAPPVVGGQVVEEATGLPVPHAVVQIASVEISIDDIRAGTAPETRFVADGEGRFHVASLAKLSSAVTLTVDVQPPPDRTDLLPLVTALQWGLDDLVLRLPPALMWIRTARPDGSLATGQPLFWRKIETAVPNRRVEKWHAFVEDSPGMFRLDTKPGWDGTWLRLGDAAQGQQPFFARLRDLGFESSPDKGGIYTLVVPAECALSVEVVSTTGRPVAGAKAELLYDGWGIGNAKFAEPKADHDPTFDIPIFENACQLLQSGVADASGRLELSCRRAPLTYLRVGCAGYSSHIRPLAADSIHERVELFGCGTVSGQVRGYDRQCFLQLQLEGVAQTLDRTETYTTLWQADGSFRIVDVPFGTHALYLCGHGSKSCLGDVVVAPEGNGRRYVFDMPAFASTEVVVRSADLVTGDTVSFFDEARGGVQTAHVSQGVARAARPRQLPGLSDPRARSAARGGVRGGADRGAGHAADRTGGDLPAEFGFGPAGVERAACWITARAPDGCQGRRPVLVRLRHRCGGVAAFPFAARSELRPAGDRGRVGGTARWRHPLARDRRQPRPHGRRRGDRARRSRGEAVTPGQAFRRCSRGPAAERWPAPAGTAADSGSGSGPAARASS